jgi:hypothetical protein
MAARMTAKLGWQRSRHALIPCRIIAVSSLGGFPTPAAGVPGTVRARPASENLSQFRTLGDSTVLGAPENAGASEALFG